MNVAIAGSTGFIGQALVQTLHNNGHSPVRLVRGTPREGQSAIAWDPANKQLDPAALEGIDAVVCLSGENIAGRWTAAKKKAILNSRVDTASLLADTMAAMSNPPRTFVCASAVGYYGNRGDETLDESSPSGQGFLAEVCRAWEAAARPAAEAGIRTVTPRWGVVLDPQGGFLKQITPLFRAGLGGVIGSGNQYMSWITREDVAGIVRYALETDTLSGPVNGTAPVPVTNREFTKALGRVLHRPTWLPVPAAAVKLALGEAGEALALASTRAVPNALESAGYRFAHPALEPALEELYARD